MTALNGATIVVTRPVAQAGTLCRLIESQGGRVLSFPTLAIDAVTPDEASLANALQSDWLLFTSTNAVDFARPALSGKMPAAGSPRIAAVGAATAEALRQAGWTVDCVPASQFSSEGLLAEPLLHPVDGLTCTIVRGVGGRDILRTRLTERGAVVNYLDVYRRYCPAQEPTVLTARLGSADLDAITITSVEALANLLTLVGNEHYLLLKAVTLVVVSERIKQAAIEWGFQQVRVSDAPSDASIVETLTTLLSGEDRGRRHSRAAGN